MADSKSAQQGIINRAATKQARAIFYKIETLVYEAVRTEVDHEIEAAITAHFAKTTPPDNDETYEENDRTNAAHHAEFAAIRHLISGYVAKVIEQEAPAIITKTLAKALHMPPPTHPDKRARR